MSTTYGFTNKYLTKDKKPWFPVMGEIHFSRYRADLWEESLRKMKAGGLSIASFLTGSQDIDDDAVWEQYKSDLESYNLSRVLEIRQAAYDRYLER